MFAADGRDEYELVFCTFRALEFDWVFLQWHRIATMVASVEGCEMPQLWMNFVGEGYVLHQWRRQG